MTDFGLAKEVAELPAKPPERKLSLVGSAFWMAPEMLRGEPYDRKVRRCSARLSRFWPAVPAHRFQPDYGQGGGAKASLVPTLVPRRKGPEVWGCQACCLLCSARLLGGSRPPCLPPPLQASFPPPHRWTSSPSASSCVRSWAGFPPIRRCSRGPRSVAPPAPSLHTVLLAACRREGLAPACGEGSAGQERLSCVLTASALPPQDYGLDVAAFRDMIGGCPQRVLDLAVSCCRVRWVAGWAASLEEPLGVSPPPSAASLD